MLEKKALSKLLSTLSLHDAWRKKAATCYDFYDGDQISDTDIELMKSKGLAPIVRNQIGPVVDVLRGLLEKTQADFKVHGLETDQDVDLANMLSAKLNKMERMTHTDDAMLDSFSDALIGGVGWVEVSKPVNPFEGTCQVSTAPPSEIWWDLSARKPDLSDARWLVRKNMFDRDQVLSTFPDHAELINKVCAGSHGFDLAPPFTMMQDELNWADEDWRNVDRDQVTLYEVWYREFVNKDVLIARDGRVIEFDKDNMAHLFVLATQAATLENRSFPVVRLAWWMGPYRLDDTPSPYLHNFFPYVPIWAFKKWKTKTPYGLVSRMLSAQEEANSRASKQFKLIDGMLVFMDSDAVDNSFNTLGEVRESVTRSGKAMVVTNPNSTRGAAGVNIRTFSELSGAQANATADAFDAIWRVAGVNQQMMGQVQSGADSGVAISNLVEQASTVVAPLFGRQLRARKQVGELMLSIIQQALGKQERAVSYDQEDGTAKTITVNSFSFDANGEPYMANDIMAMRMKVDVGNVPSTESYRKQFMHDLMEIIRSMAPGMQEQMMVIAVEESDLKNRRKLAHMMRQSMAMAPVNPALSGGGSPPQPLS